MITFYLVMALATLIYATSIAERNNDQLRTLAKANGQADWFMAQPNYQQLFWIAVCWPGYIFGKLYVWYTKQEVL